MRGVGGVTRYKMHNPYQNLYILFSPGLPNLENWGENVHGSCGHDKHQEKSVQRPFYFLGSLHSSNKHISPGGGGGDSNMKMLLGI